jgi:DNA-binding response OmpR family regulator
VLVVEDSASVRSLVVASLEVEGFLVADAANGEEALDRFDTFRPDVVVLDIGLPGIDGFQLIGHLRRSGDVGVILLSGRVDESDRVLGLDLGADDYVVKPFLPHELAARVRAVWRRRGHAVTGARRLKFPDLEIDLDARSVLVRGESVRLRRREFDLLARLASYPRRVFSREELLRDVWDSSSEWQDVRTVTEHVRRVRVQIEADPSKPRYIRSARGSGYYFNPEGS